MIWINLLGTNKEVESSNQNFIDLPQELQDPEKLNN